MKISKYLVLQAISLMLAVVVLMPSAAFAQKNENSESQDSQDKIQNQENKQFDREDWHPRKEKDFHSRVCDQQDNNNDTAECHARIVTDSFRKPKEFITPSGYGAKQLAAAYGVLGLSGQHRIIGIVDAYDHPYIKNDLDVYSSQFGIPSLPNCRSTIASSPVACFKKVDQRGGTRYPSKNAGWALEIALDVEAAHAICPDCSILLVEADSNSYDNLLAALDKAAALGARAISNSWGTVEFAGENTFDFHFNKPGVAITFSSGDAGFGPQYPAASPYVTAVGGTSLTMNGLSYAGETAWSGSGSGCSAYETKPGWQTDSGCTNRTIADVSAVADPSTGAAVYDSVRYQGTSGWFQVGGTSLSSPIIAAVYALSNNTASPSLPYTLGGSNNLNDVLTGSNGSCGASYLCTAGIGYDGPTGLGSPRGVSAF